jgi:hypothetical protein
VILNANYRTKQKAWLFQKNYLQEIQWFTANAFGLREIGVFKIWHKHFHEGPFRIFI